MNLAKAQKLPKRVKSFSCKNGFIPKVFCFFDSHLRRYPTADG